MNKHYFLIVVLIFLSAFAANAQTNVFTYQGRLTDSQTANGSGSYLMEFRLFAETSGGAAIDVLTDVPVTVSNNIFTVQLNFTAANAFDGGEKFLEIAVKRNAGENYVTLTPRQPITATPYSSRAANATRADALSAQCVGCVDNGKIAGGVDAAKISGTVANAANAQTATVAGNVSGIVAIQNGGTGSQTQNFVDLSTNQTIGGDKTFSGALSGNGTNLTNLNGANIADNSIANSKLAPDARSKFDTNLVALQRWDLLPNLKTIQFSGTSALQGFAFDGTFVYFVRGDTALVRIRAATGAVEDNSITIPGAAVISHLIYDGTFIYVSQYSLNRVLRVRAATGTLEGSPIAVGNRPSGMVFDGTFVYVANAGGGTVTRIRAATGAVEGSPIAISGAPYEMVFDGTFVYVSNFSNDTVTRIRAATGAIEGSPIAVGDGPVSLAFDGTFVYVANETGNTVSRIRASTGAVEGAAIAVGNSPNALAFDGTFVHVALYNADVVVRIRATTGAIEGSPMPAGDRPSDLLFDGISIYAMSYGDRKITRFVP